MSEHVPSHECELIEPDGSVWSLGGVSLGARFTVFGARPTVRTDVTADDIADAARRIGLRLEPWQRNAVDAAMRHLGEYTVSVSDASDF